MATTSATRTSNEAIAMAKLMTARINKERKKAKKDPLSQSQVIALAIENITVTMGVER